MRHPATYLIRHLPQRMGDLVEKARFLGLDSAYQRIVQIVDDAAMRNDETELGSPTPTQQAVAWAGSSRQLVSRIVADLRAGGQPEQHGESLVLAAELPPRWLCDVARSGYNPRSTLRLPVGGFEK